MDINELITIVKNKLLNQINIESINIEDKSFLHKNHKGNQEGKYHLKLIIVSEELKKMKVGALVVMIVDIRPLLRDLAARLTNPNNAIHGPTGPDHWSMWPSKLRLDQVLHQINVVLPRDESFWISLLWPVCEELEPLTHRGDAPHPLDLGLDFVDGMGEAHD